MTTKERLSLKQWFGRRTSGRLIVANLIVLVIGVSLVAVIVSGDFASREAAIDDLRQVAPRAVTQQNRPMLEALLLSFGQRVQATALGLCFNQQEVMSVKSRGSLCVDGAINNSTFSILKRTNLPGLFGYSVYFVVPIFPHLTEISLVVLAAALMILLNMLLMKQVSEILWRDLIEPLRGATLDGVQIAEVHELLMAKEKAVSGEAIRKLSLQVAHDIRSPLSALNVLVQRSEGLEKNQREMLTAISSRIGGIAEDLLRKSPESKISAINIDDTLSNLLDEKRLEIEGSGLSVTQVKNEQPVFALGVAEDFKRVVSNLLNNSIDASSRAGNIEVSTVTEDKYVSVVVKDDGSGISPEVLKELGKRPISTKSGGHGLGISGAYEIAKSWGGSLSFDTNEGRGTKVIWKLVKS